MFDAKPGSRGLSTFEDPTGLIGFRDAKGGVAISPRFRFAYQFSPEGVAAVIDDDGAAFIDVHGTVLARAFLYDNGPDYFTEGLARVVQNDKVGFVSRRGRIVIEPRFRYASAFCHGRAAVCEGCQPDHSEPAFMQGGRWGFIDRRGRLVVPMKFDEVQPFEGDHAEAVLAGKKVLIDPQGRLVPNEDDR